MPPSEPQPTTPGNLRTRAEGLTKFTGDDIAKMSKQGIRKLVYELQVHQTELEVQNEELLNAQAELAHARDRLADLIDFAPVGFLTTLADGKIREVNMTASKILDIERKKLSGNRFAVFLALEDRTSFNQHLKAAFSTGEKQSGDFILNTREEPTIVRLETVVLKGDNVCRIALSDITAERQARELQLEQRSHQASEAEKARIAERLHDDLGSLLKGIDLHLTAMANRLRQDELEEAANLEAIVGKVGEAVSLTKDLSFSLYPVGSDQAQFCEALRSLEGLSPAVKCQISISENAFQLPNDETANHLFRIAQEAVHNAIHHSGADEVKIWLEASDDRVALSVCDNGSGFEREKANGGGLGLRIMEHRARSIGWTLQFLNGAEAGTTVVCFK